MGPVKWSITVACTIFLLGKVNSQRPIDDRGPCMRQCPDDEVCKLRQVQCFRAPCRPVPECVKKEPVDRPDLCRLPCPMGQVCKHQQVQCFRAPCPLVPACVTEEPVEDPDLCKSMECPAGEVCELQQVQCFRAPCPPVPACVKDVRVDNTKTCQGQTCPDGQVCQMLDVQCESAPCPRLPGCVSRQEQPTDNDNDPTCLRAQEDAINAAKVNPYLPIYIPKCDHNGNWKPVQCHNTLGVCWCVSSQGDRIPGTQVRGVPKCAATDLTSGKVDEPVCEAGVAIHSCSPDLCQRADCPFSFYQSLCLINPCGGCQAVFYNLRDGYTSACYMDMSSCDVRSSVMMDPNGDMPKKKKVPTATLR